ncbi:MAG: hypothetical protein VKN72_17625 [Nostocales cyanobacterium 94392]|nr:hypothetical protein [Nostocales cyanobacterium 94392]
MAISWRSPKRVLSLKNDQWRICFVWTDENNASDVEIVDYH